jgi:hypothetical protein
VTTQQNLAGEQAHVIAGQDPPDCARVPRRPDSRQARRRPGCAGHGRGGGQSDAAPFITRH